MPVLDQFARHLSASSTQALGEAKDRLAVHLLDTIAAWIAGRHSSEGKAMAGDDAGVLPPLFGDGLADRIALAAAQTRLTEVDDIHMPSCTTVGAVIVPAVLTLAARTGASQAQVLEAMAAGYEATTRLGTAIDGANILYRGIWPTFFAAPFGAAAATASLLGLDDEAHAHALAMALVQVSGAAGGPAPRRNPRWLLAGWATAAGVRAGIAAARGFGGDISLLDEDWFEATHGLAFDPSEMTVEREPAILAMSIKPVCIAKQAAAALSSFQQLMAQAPVGEMGAIRLYAPAAYHHMICRQPPGRLGRIVSVKWQCALAALYPEELLDIERIDHSGEAAFSALMDRIDVETDDSLAIHFPTLYPARAEAELKKGGMIQTEVLAAPGDPDNRLAEADERAKAEALMMGACAKGFAKDVLTAFDNFHTGRGSAADLYESVTLAEPE